MMVRCVLKCMFVMIVGLLHNWCPLTVYPSCPPLLVMLLLQRAIKAFPTELLLISLEFQKALHTISISSTSNMAPQSLCHVQIIHTQSPTAPSTIFFVASRTTVQSYLWPLQSPLKVSWHVKSVRWLQLLDTIVRLQLISHSSHQCN